MLMTFEEDLAHVGIYINPGLSTNPAVRFDKKNFNPNISPKEISEYRSLDFKSASDLKGC